MKKIIKSTSKFNSKIEKSEETTKIEKPKTAKIINPKKSTSKIIDRIKIEKKATNVEIDDKFVVRFKPEDIAPSSKFIEINNATLHTLKGVTVKIPRNRLTVITGVSGSGKSTLAFDTLYAEGQRRFVESISSYARQFLERMHKPEVDSILGLPPAIAIEQLPPNKNPRSTVGTSTEIYDYFKLLFGRIGKTYCAECGKLVKKDSPDTVVKNLEKLEEGARLYIMFQFSESIIDVIKELKKYYDAGFFRIVMSSTNEIVDLNENPPTGKIKPTDFYVLVDRIIYRRDEENLSRLAESIESAFSKGNGTIVIRDNTDVDNIKDYFYSSRYECNECKIIYEEPDPKLFVFNNPLGACSVCQGFGRTVGIDEDLVIPDKTKSLEQQAIAPFKGNTITNIYSINQRILIEEAKKYDIPINKPYNQLSAEEQKAIWEGFGRYDGLNSFFAEFEDKAYKIQNTIFLSKYRGYTVCRRCSGSRLKTSARQVFVSGFNLPELVKMPINKLLEIVSNFELDEYQIKVANHVLKEIIWRTQLLVDIGLEYLTLDRLMHTLSGGEAQRINLSTALGSALVGTLYVLDEPSIGLHPRDTNRLINILHKLRNLGNTVVVVEHDPDIMANADYIIDMGPFAGEFGGEIIFAGTYKEILESETSITGKYLSGKFEMDIVKDRKKPEDFISLIQPYENNLLIERVDFPLNCITVVTGVSGSGKSTLVRDVFFNGVRRKLGSPTTHNGKFKSLENYKSINNIEYVDQSSIGKSSRSTPATYTKVFDDIRQLFANTQASKQLGWRDGHFSFNVPGGRCEACEGEGVQVVEMQFLSDVTLECEVCHGKRYKKEVLNITYKDKNIVDVLEMTVDEAIILFEDVKKIVKKLKLLQDVGLGYLKLGQPASQLSGGEAQRLKLSTYLDTHENWHTIFVFDEPTTGLHFFDIAKLIDCFNILVKNGHTVILIEHNLNLITAADWVIDLGPEAGINGGQIVGKGTPEEIALLDTHTGRALKSFMKL